MEPESLFHWIFVTVFIGALSTSAFFRHRARKSGDVIPRAREGKLLPVARLLFAAPLYLSLLAYMIHPQWMAWSAVRLPDGVRWLAAAVGLAMLPLLVWVLQSLGRNISETVLTKQVHALITHGPYRWVRHPLYATASVAFLALGVLAANWFMMGMALLVAVGVAVMVVPREEAELEEKFGIAYQDYRKRTGRFVPRFGTTPTQPE